MAHKIEAQVRYIGSIFPGEVPVCRRNYGESFLGTGKNAARSTLFKLEPVRRGTKPFVLRVPDSFETVLDVKTGKLTMTNPVPCEDIVSDLLGVWTGGLFNVPQGAKPGIIEIVNSTFTQAELDQAKAQQALYFEYLFSEGERLAKENLWKEITMSMRLAADWLGHKRNWSHPDIAKNASACPFCQEIVSNLALVCPSCSRTIREIPPELLKLSQQQPVGKSA